MLGGIGPMELMIVGIVGLLLFGKRVPEVARNLGRSLNEFKRGIYETPEPQPRPVASDEPAGHLS